MDAVENSSDNNYDNQEYAGFWARIGAYVVDSIIVALIGLPTLLLIYGEEYLDPEGPFLYGPADFLIAYVFPAIATILFWVYKSATPGKMVIHAKIVDANTGEPPSTAQCIGRFFSYFLSIIPFGLGFLWIIFDKKKQGWHDKLAGTVVIRLTGPTDKVHFPEKKE